ncbi:MAG: hypothetical protein U0704_09215 [Candidatus Eisenbacteria bacterium]
MSLAVLSLLACAPLAPAASASEAPAVGIAVETLPQWWSAPGRAGWAPTALESGALPWSFAGLAAGGWRIDDPFAPSAAHFGGLYEAQAPIAWYDSVAIVTGGDAAWTGFGAAVATARGILRTPSNRQQRAVWTLVNGDGGLERHSLLLSRGDERSWLRAGATGGKRSGLADMGPGADHLWGVEGGTRRGAHTFDLRFSQRGTGEGQLGGSQTFEEGGRARSGALGWAWSGEGQRASLRLTRDVEQRTSDARSGGVFGERDLWTNGAELALAQERGERGIEARLAWSESRAVRTAEWRRLFEAWNHTEWLALRAHAPLAGGRLELGIGGGRDRDLALREQRWQLAPSAEWTRTGSLRWRAYGERALQPVWHSLDRNFSPGAFLQDTWIGGLEASAGAPGRSAHVGVAGGRVGGRAVLGRYPISDVSQRLGWAMDEQPYGFALAEAVGEWSVRAVSADARGYVLARDESRTQANVDPALGGAAGLNARFALFTGDLKVRLRAEAAWVGERWSEGGSITFDDRLLPGYATFGAGATLGIGDATVLLRWDGLENTRHDLSWLDPARYPEEVLARTAGRRFRFEVSWPLMN